MKRKLDSVLLVDDDKDCNFFHQRLITKMDCVENIYVSNDGQEAIEFLTSLQNENRQGPDIIFLDINMPRKNGWEFIEDYEKLNESVKAKAVFIMLSSALNMSDIESAKKYKEIKGYKNKYLNKEVLEKILHEFFPDYL